MTSIACQHRIDSARTEQEVVEASREFLSSFSLVELSDLPLPCRPPAKLFGREDVSAYAFDLVRHECETRQAAEIVHKLARFFSLAATRLTHIASRRYLERQHLLPVVDQPERP